MAMHAQRYWVENGIMTLAVDSTGDTIVDDRKRFSQGQVRITSGAAGSEVKWLVLTPCVASLFVAMEWLRTADGPCVLRFYADGWFEEFHPDGVSAISRIEDTISRGDRHFPGKIMLHESDISPKNLTPLLAAALNDAESVKDFAVECVFDEPTQNFFVHNIGQRSVVAKIWGTFPYSFPCQTASSYSHAVSAAYSEVMATGKPRHHHVLAAMRMPNNELFWVPYRRVIVPKEDGNKSGVYVISEIGPVDIRLI